MIDDWWLMIDDWWLMIDDIIRISDLQQRDPWPAPARRHLSETVWQARTLPGPHHVQTGKQ